MLKNKPAVKYCGLTVILSNPGRFDKQRLLTANGSVFFSNSCLQPEFNQMMCEVRLADDRSPLLPETKCILLCGEYAMHQWCPDTRNNTLNEFRGSPLYVMGTIPAIATFFPQDAVDKQNYEKLNELSKSNMEDEASENDEEEDDSDTKQHGATKRSNYAFWIKRDVWKCKQILLNNWTRWPVEPEPQYKIYPSCDEVINVLNSHKDCLMFYDKETDIEEQNWQTFSFSFNEEPIVYCVPILNYDYKWAYSGLPYIIRSFSRAIKDNILVAHNGSGFDFFILAAKYHLPFFRVYDTMLTAHRFFPDIEKSLGHLISYWTYQRFHKDTNPSAYFTNDQMISRLRYNGKDVFGLRLIYYAMQKYIKTIPGLVESVACAQRSIRPYLISSIQGVSYSEEKVKEQVRENDRLMKQYIRIIEMLIGPTGLGECKRAIKSGKAKAFPGSNKQCISYFHEQLNYPVAARSRETGQPSLGKGALYKLALAHDNPVILFTFLYRKVLKETGALKFNPWKDDSGRVFPRIKPKDDDQNEMFTLQNSTGNLITSSNKSTKWWSV